MLSNSKSAGQPRCRFCRTPLRDTFVNLGMSPLCESYVAAAQLNDMEAFYPLHVRVCRECFLVQLPAYESPERIFSDYPYFSGYSDMALGLAVGLMLEGTYLFQHPSDSLSSAYGEPGELTAQSQRFQQLLVHLPETERAILELHYSHGLQFTEVAKILGLSKGRISQLHKEALKALRQLLRSRPGLDLRM